MSYYIPCDEVITSASAQYTTAEIETGSAVSDATLIKEKDLCKWEIFAERVQRLKRLGYGTPSF